MAATIALAGVAALQPASAAQQWADYEYASAQADTHPGNGAPSWVWGYVQPVSSSALLRGSVDYRYSDGSEHSVWIAKGQAVSINTDDVVTDIRACDEWAATPDPRWECGPWTHVG